MRCWPLASVALLAIVPRLAGGQTVMHTAGADDSAVVRWRSGAPGADQLWKDGVLIESLSRDSVAVSVSLVVTDKKTQVGIAVANNSARRFDVLPERLSLLETAPHQKLLEYNDPIKMAKSIKKKAAWGAALTQFGGSLQTKQTTSSTTSRASVHAIGTGGYASARGYGTSTTTTESPDDVARLQASEQARAITANAAIQAADIVTVALKANTLLPGESTSGVAFFDRDKHAESFLLRVPVGHVVYEFPLTRTRE
jgi:hypothetical protein